jgi:hypothetical protein
MQNIFEVLEKYYGFTKILWFLKATGGLNATNLVVSKTIVLLKL